MAGYSSNPLHKKLGLKQSMTCLRVNVPDDYEALLGSDAPRTVPVARLDDRPFCSHIFSTEREKLLGFLVEARQKMDRNGMIWVSWPKRASKVRTDITEDVIRELCLPMGLVDVKVCAVSEVWSGLKLVIRKELR